jgi:hypothetical protein
MKVFDCYSRVRNTADLVDVTDEMLNKLAETFDLYNISYSFSLPKIKDDNDNTVIWIWHMENEDYKFKLALSLWYLECRKVDEGSCKETLVKYLRGTL